MRNSPSIGLILGCLSFLNCTARAADWNVRDHVTADKVIIQSHRGAGVLAPENTSEAFELGWKLGTVPECDIRRTRDGVIVTFHDADFSRVVRGASEQLKKKKVQDVTWDELSKLDVGSWLGGQFQGHRVRKASEVFALMSGKPERHLYLDIKSVDLKKLAEEVRAAKVERQVILASTKYEIIREWKSLVPESGTLLWMGGTEEALSQRFAELRKTEFADVTQLQIHIYLKPEADLSKPDPFTLSDDFLRQAGQELRRHNILYQTLPWNTQNPAVYHKLMDLGVASFATDHPDLTQKALGDYYKATAGQHP